MPSSVFQSYKNNKRVTMKGVCNGTLFTIQLNKSICILVIQTIPGYGVVEIFPSKNNPKNLDPSYKMDLDFWVYSRGGRDRENPHLLTKQIWECVRTA